MQNPSINLGPPNPVFQGTACKNDYCHCHFGTVYHQGHHHQPPAWASCFPSPWFVERKPRFKAGVQLGVLEPPWNYKPICCRSKVRLHFFRERVHNFHQILKYSVSPQKIKNHFLRRKALKQKLVEVSGRWWYQKQSIFFFLTTGGFFF